MGRYDLCRCEMHFPSLSADLTCRLVGHQSSGGRAMDHQFDVLTRVFATCTSRREALALLAAMTVAGSRPGRASAQGDASTCESGLTDCGGTCVDLQSDLNNCGACGEICESGLVPVECRSGVCERANCPVGIDVLRHRGRLPRPHLRSGTLRGLRQRLRQRSLQRWRLRRGRRYLRGRSGRLRRYLRRYVLQQQPLRRLRQCLSSR